MAENENWIKINTADIKRKLMSHLFTLFGITPIALTNKTALKLSYSVTYIPMLMRPQ